MWRMSSTACSIGDSSSRLGYPSIRLEAAQDCYSLDSITYITAAFLFGIFGFQPIFGFQSFSEFFGEEPLGRKKFLFSRPSDLPSHDSSCQRNDCEELIEYLWEDP
jgi:hypothetical protein